MESGLNMTLPAGLIPAFPMLFRKGENPMKKRICCFTFLILLSLFFFALPETKADAPAPASGKDQQNILYSGVGEDGLSWQLTGDGTLTISGSGQMYPYDPVHEAYCGYDQRPWHSCRALIHTAVVEEGVTNVGEYAFYDCPNLTQIILADSVTRIDYMAFGDCTGLTAVTIGKNVRTVGDCSYRPAFHGGGAFLGCRNLKSIAVEAGNGNYISEDGVLYSGDMTILSAYPAGKTDPSYRILDGVEYIEPCTFMGCVHLKTVLLPDSLDAIGGYAFADCSHLRYLTMPLSLTGIDTLAFMGCTELSDVYYQGSRTQWDSIYNEDIYLSDGIRLAEDPQAEITDYFPVFPIHLHCGVLAYGICGENGGDNVTWTLYQSGLMSISGAGRMGWDDEPPWGRWKDSIRTAEIADGVANLYDWSFTGCSNLREISIPDSVNEISWQCFMDCSSLVSVILPSGLTSVPYELFRGCTSLADVTLPDGLTGIGNGAFDGCAGLSSVSIPDSVTSIGTLAFAACPGLASITLPAGLRYDASMIYEDIFLNSVNLTEILVASGNEDFASADGVLFDQGMTKLLVYPAGKKDSTYGVPDGVKDICYGAFDNHAHIHTLILPHSIETIGPWVFSRTVLSGIIYHGTAAGWEAVSIDGDNPDLANIPVRFLPGADIVLPASLTAVEIQAFQGIPEGSVVFIPGSVTAIADGAFDEGTVIVAPVGSFAAQWAETHGFEWYPQ